MTPEEWSYGIAIVEDEFACDLDAVTAHLKAELAACALAVRVSEKSANDA